MKALLKTTSFITLASSTILFSEQTVPIPPAKPTAPVKAAPETITKQPKGTITPPVLPLVQKGLELIVDADFIWWKSQLSGTNFATINNKDKNLPSQFEPGFKLGVGLDLGFDGWDSYAGYTWVNQPWTKSSFKGKQLGLANFVIPDIGLPLNFFVEKGTVSNKQQLNIADVEIGRNFFISKRLTLRPHFGLKLARMFEKIKISEEGVTLLNTSTSSDLFFQQSLSGVGIRAGIDTGWHVTSHLGLYGDLAVTTLWSNFHNNATSDIQPLDFQHKIKTSNSTIIPVIEAGLGISYITWLKQERYQLYAKAGWEEQIWINYNQIDINNVANNTGNLTMHGLTIKMGLAF